MDKIHKYVEDFLTHYRFQDNVRNLILNKDVIGFNIKNNILRCVVDIHDNNKDFIKELTNDLSKTLREIKGISEVKFTFTKEQKNKIKIPGAKKTILISSGKGGVGKSTITFFLAQYLQKQGFKIGILDADIYGPSLPTLTKINEKPKMQNGAWIPHMWNKISVNSIGYLISDDESLIWRGPMISKAIHQLLNNTQWHDLDYLLVDMPPGTGDIHLSIGKNYDIDGSILVSTSHDLSIIDTSRTLNMYKKLSLNILGIIENMSFLEKNGKREYIFGKNEAIKEISKKYNIPILTKIPIVCNNDIDDKYFKNVLNFLP